MPRSVELTRSPRLTALLKSRLFQPGLMLLTLFFFVVAILASFFGTPAGSHNFGINFVWIVWWALLIIVMVPFFGRMWCAICPIPGPGEWLQRRGIVRHTPGRLLSLRWRWPRRLRNIWLQNFCWWDWSSRCLLPIVSVASTRGQIAKRGAARCLCRASWWE